METVIGSIRKVNWGSMQLNFSVVFPAGILENAPQFNVLTTYVPNEASSADLQRDLVKLYGIISVFILTLFLNVDNFRIGMLNSFIF